MKIYQIYNTKTSLSLHRMCMAESHARLNLRSTVLDEDAVIVIFIYEELIVSKTGECVSYLIMYTSLNMSFK